MWNYIPRYTFPYIWLGGNWQDPRWYHGSPLAFVTRGLKIDLLDADAAVEAFFVAVVMGDGFFGVAPAVIPLTVVEVDEP